MCASDWGFWNVHHAGVPHVTVAQLHAELGALPLES
jgi:hypothetical protein